MAEQLLEQQQGLAKDQQVKLRRALEQAMHYLDSSKCELEAAHHDLESANHELSQAQQEAQHSQHESERAKHESQQAQHELKLRLTAHAAELVAVRQQHMSAVANLQLKNTAAVQVSCHLYITDHACGVACCHLATEEMLKFIYSHLQQGHPN